MNKKSDSNGTKPWRAHNPKLEALIDETERYLRADGSLVGNDSLQRLRRKGDVKMSTRDEILVEASKDP